MDPWETNEFTEQLRHVGRQQYHDKHPFHQLMNEGGLNRDQVRLWVANRFYYQKNIPIKDAILLSRCHLVEVRRKWVQRIIDHDGMDGDSGGGDPGGGDPGGGDPGGGDPGGGDPGSGDPGGGDPGGSDPGGSDPGGIEKWLRLGEGVGLSRDDLESDRMLLPGVRYAVDAYVNFVATRPWIEGVASSLTELFAPGLMAQRIAAFETHYTWVDPAALAYFRSRLSLAARDSEYGLELVLNYCRGRDQQELAVAALRFKCDVLWSQLDALYYECVAPIHSPRHRDTKT